MKNNNYLQKSLAKAKNSSERVALLSTKEKNTALSLIKKGLDRNKEKIVKENEKDLRNAIKKGMSKAFIDRLTISDKTFKEMVNQLNQIIKLKDPIGKVLEKRVLKNGVFLHKIRVPLGVLAVIYESRPNVTLDVAALCIKSGNTVVLKGGSEALHSNKAIVKIIHEALVKSDIPIDVVTLIDAMDRKVVSELLKQHKYIDVVIPRGGYKLVRKVVKESSIPVLYHAEGGARIYVDKSADLKLAEKIIINAKTNRPATCNSLDTLIIHKEISNGFKGLILNKLRALGVRISKDYKKEFLDLVMSVKVVSDEDGALEFIKKYSKGHTEGIIAKDKKVIDKFVKEIDAATLFINCSTRLHDGGIFGLGAEMGIATGKLHARGPVGLNELTTYKWVAYGKGQVRN